MIKGILFDKDGTLIEFNSLWIETTHQLIRTLSNEFATGNALAKSKCIAQRIGLNGNEVKEDGLLAGDTAKDIANVIADVLQVDEASIHERVNAYYYEKTVQQSGKIRAIGDIASLFHQLKKHQLKIGIVTADNLDVTQFTLKRLGVLDDVDFIATADMYKKKPHVEAMAAFCNQFHLQQNEVIHVGDTIVDMEFAKHGRFGVGVLSGVSLEATLRKFTPFIIESVEQLVDGKGKFIFENE